MLTNGDEYRLYNAHAAVDVDEKLFRSIRLSDEDQETESLETLSLLARERMQQDAVIDTLWKVQFVDRRIRSAVDRLFAQEDPRLLNLIRKEVSELSPADIRESLRRARVRIDFGSADCCANIGQFQPSRAAAAVRADQKRQRSPRGRLDSIWSDRSAPDDRGTLQRRPAHSHGDRRRADQLQRQDVRDTIRRRQCRTGGGRRSPRWTSPCHQWLRSGRYEMGPRSSRGHWLTCVRYIVLEK